MGNDEFDFDMVVNEDSEEEVEDESDDWIGLFLSIFLFF